MLKKKINVNSVIGILVAVGAGIGAFYAEVENQKKSALIEDLVKRVTNLESKGTN